MDIKPFKLAIPSSSLSLLQQKLQLTRLPTSLSNAAWTESSTNNITIPFLTSILYFWKETYSWRTAESQLNTLPQYTVLIPISGFGTLNIHFIHSPSSHPNSIPLLYLHGWPGSVNEISKTLPLLNKSGFHVIAPSLPGWLTSSTPTQKGFKLAQHAEVAHKLMQKLGYERYVVQGGDWGGEIGPVLANMYPEHVLALHLNYFPVPPSPKLEGKTEKEYSEFEEHSIAGFKHWLKNETAYCLVQQTKPLTLGVGLHDSPMGMLAWMADKLFSWSDCTPRNGRGYEWTYEEIVTWTLLHWFADGGPTAPFALYVEQPLGSWGGREFVKVKTGVSAFRGESEMVPRSWAETEANVVWWREHEIGGHFAMYERPEEMVRDVVDFVEEIGLRKGNGV